MKAAPRIALAPLALCLTALTACTSAPVSDLPPSIDDTAPYVEPAWMAAQSQQYEEYIASMGACLTAAGLAFERSGVDGFKFPVEVAQISQPVFDQCDKEHSPFRAAGPPTTDQLALLYSRTLDLRQCILDQGYATGAPGSQEDFIETGGGSWSPYGETFETDRLSADGKDPDAEWIRLNQICPQPDLSLP